MSASSTESLGNEEVVTQTESAPVTVAAESTPAKEPSILDAVEKALRPESGVDAGAPTAEPRSTKDEVKPNTPSAGEPAEISDEEMKQFSPNAQKRIRELAAQKNDLKGKLDSYASSPEQVELKGKAENYDRLSGFLTRNGISSDEANNTLEITRLIKAGDYSAAHKIMQPIWEELQKRTGQVLDPDLQNDVRLGHVPQERALELQRLRATDAATRQRSEREAETSRQQQEQSTWNSHVNTVARAADDWAKTKAGSDPDWDKKATEIAEIVELDLRRNGFPKSKEEAVQRSEKALEAVNKRWASLRPAPTEIRPNLGNGRASTRSDAKPKTALDAVNAALGE